jgi:hypothetical protein
MKELWSANSWDTVYQTPKEKYISIITENAAGGIKED